MVFRLDCGSARVAKFAAGLESAACRMEKVAPEMVGPSMIELDSSSTELANLGGKKWACCWSSVACLLWKVDSIHLEILIGLARIGLARFGATKEKTHKAQSGANCKLPAPIFGPIIS